MGYVYKYIRGQRNGLMVSTFHKYIYNIKLCIIQKLLQYISFLCHLDDFLKALLLMEILMKAQMGVNKPYILAAISALITVWKLLHME